MARKLNPAASVIREALGFSPQRSRKWSAEYVVGKLIRLGERREVGFDVYTAALGISWALGSARLDGQLHMAIVRLDPRLAINLVAAVAAACPVIGDVPAYLFAHREEIIAGKV